MTTGTVDALHPEGNTKQTPALDADPDSYRMTVGEHLEELRLRLILALVGLFVAVLACLPFCEKVLGFLCLPLIHQLRTHDINPQIHYRELTEPFMTYLKVAIICSIAIAGPWMIYQIWQFIAAGLYPHERKMVTRYIPLSVTLFLSGIVFVYLVVLPLTIAFFIDFGSLLNVPFVSSAPAEVVVKNPYTIPMVAGNIKDAPPGALWIDTTSRELKLMMPALDGDPKHAKVRVIPFGPDKLAAPIITLGDYVDLVLTFMLTFGLAFQLPLVVLALVSLNIVEVEFLKKKRKVIYFGMTVASAFIAPGDIVTSMLALLIPLIILYEFGLWLVAFSRKRAAAAPPTST